MIGLTWDTRVFPLEGLNMSASSRREPWFHASSAFWCAQINGKRHYLDRDPAIAEKKLNKLLQDLKRGDDPDRNRLPEAGGPNRWSLSCSSCDPCARHFKFCAAAPVPKVPHIQLLAIANLRDRGVGPDKLQEKDKTK
jgi:hypothetical protein